MSLLPKGPKITLGSQGPFILGRDLLLWGYLALRRPRVGWRVLRDRGSRRRAWERRRRLRAWREAALRRDREVRA